MEIKKDIIKALKKELGYEPSLEIPPQQSMGDYAFPCFPLAKKYKKSPKDVAKDLKDNLDIDNVEVQANGPYLNFFIDKGIIAKKVLKEVFKNENYGNNKGKKEKIIVEYPGPNTNKPLHLGHVRNIVLGSSLINILKANGKKVIPVNINNDRGVHICKSMLAYQKWGKDDTPEKSNLKSDHFVGKYYVLFAKKAKEKPQLEEEALEMLKKWEDGDKEVRKLWEKMNKWAFEGFKETYKKFNVEFEKEYYESETYKEGKEIVLKGVEKGIFKKNNEGAVIIDLESKGYGEKVLLRPDGTTVYVTQDIVLAKKRYDDFKFDKMVYVVATEQNYHFNVLFEIFKKLKYPFAEKCHHFSYGMVNLTSGKMKSREGTVVDADDLVDDLVKIAEKETKKRHKLKKEELEKRAKKIAMGALRFYIANFDPVKDFTFNPKASISFEGDTGPYVQYSYARCSSILRKYDKKVSDDVEFRLLNEDSEIALIKQLSSYPSIIEKAMDYKPSIIAHFMLEMAQNFNNFYRLNQVISTDEKVTKARILLVHCVRKVLKQGLNLLGIETMEEM